MSASWDTSIMAAWLGWQTQGHVQHEVTIMLEWTALLRQHRISILYHYTRRRTYIADKWVCGFCLSCRLSNTSPVRQSLTPVAATPDDAVDVEDACHNLWETDFGGCTQELFTVAEHTLVVKYKLSGCLTTRTFSNVPLWKTQVYPLHYILGVMLWCMHFEAELLERTLGDYAIHQRTIVNTVVNCR